MRLTSQTGLAALLAVGLIVSSVASASGEDASDTGAPVTVQEPAGISACWDNIESAPFIDTSDLSEESLAAIDCMFHYGITRGTSANTYSPADEVIRWHMAIFLIRTSKVLGLILPDEPLESFDDLESVSAEGKLAVAQLREMGITRGYSPTVFGPANNVERVHMAHFLTRLLRLTSVTLPTPGDDSYEDLQDLSADARADIGAMASLGIMEAITPVRFEPRAPVTREDMAVFLARILELAEVEPVHLELNLSSESLLVGGAAEATVRALKPDGRPYPGMLIDLFALYDGDFEDGCNLDMGARLNGDDAGTSQNCRIDGSDPRTNSEGEVTVGLAHSPEPAVNWIYAWAGTLGQEYDDAEVQTEIKARIDWQASPTRVTTVEPVSLELSLSSESLLVGGAAIATVRALKADGSPYPGLLIDVFADYGWRYGTACNLDTDARLNGGDAGTSQNCRIDIGDPRTDSNGEVTVGLAHSSESAVNWIYAWAGTLGQEFNESEVRSEVKRKIDWQPSPSRVTTIDPIGIVYEQGLAIVARLVGPNSAGQRMVLVSSYDNVVRVMRVETTNDDGSVAFSIPGLADPSEDFFQPRSVDEQILVYWDRNGNNIHDGPAELSAQTEIYWR